MYKHNKLVRLSSKMMWPLFILINMMPSISLAEMPSPHALLNQLKINQKDINRLNQGDVVLFDVDSSGETELTAGVIIYVLTTPAQISLLIKKDGLASLDPLTISWGLIPTQANSSILNNFLIDPGNSEAKKFLNVTPGDQFNLSTQEFNLIRNNDSKQTDKASEIYRKILWQRWQSYRKNGLKGIAPYDRGNNTVIEPSTDLKIASQAHDLASDYFPDIFNAWRNYPNITLPVGVEESYTWSYRFVQDRPAAILTHRFIYTNSNGEFIIARQFYAGHSFNANQLTITCLPYNNGALIFYTNRNFTDQVSGFGSSLKHLIGDNIAQKQVVDLLITLQKQFK